MKDFYYSPTEKIAFYVPNYYIDSNSNVIEFTANLLKHSEELVTACNLTNGSLKDVKSYYIESSRRHKYQRAFSIKEIETCPEGAFSLGTEHDWTMWSWLHN